MSSISAITRSAFAQYTHQPAAGASGGGNGGSPAGAGSGGGHASATQDVATETYAQLLQQAEQGNQAAIKQLAKLAAEQQQMQQPLTGTSGPDKGTAVDQEA
jgi:hypothetical protein